MSKLLRPIFLGLALVSLAFAGLLYARRWYSPVLASSLVSSSVIRLQIPDLDIDLPVVPANLHGTNWEYTSSGVSYLESSPLPGDLGNSIFYGHNWPRLLARLPQIHLGDLVSFSFADGSRRDFRVEQTQTVPASQTDILSPTASPQVTLFTCTGFLDSKRFVVVAIPL